MEYLMIVPIAAIIYGWVKATPARPHPPDLMPLRSGYDFEESVDWGCNAGDIDDSEICSSSASLSDMFADNELEISGTSLTDDMMYNPAYDWCSINIYHHEDLGCCSDDNNFNAIE